MLVAIKYNYPNQVNLISAQPKKLSGKEEEKSIKIKGMKKGSLLL